MMLAAMRPALVAGVILNDVGPEVDPAGLARIASYVGRHAPPKSWEEAAATVRATYEIGMPGLTRRAMGGICAAQLYRRRRRAEARHGPDDRRGGAQCADRRGAGPVAAVRRTTQHSDAGIPWRDVRHSFGRRPSTAWPGKSPTSYESRYANRGHTPQLDEPECIEAIDAFLARSPLNRQLQVMSAWRWVSACTCSRAYGCGVPVSWLPCRRSSRAPAARPSYLWRNASSSSSSSSSRSSSALCAPLRGADQLVELDLHGLGVAVLRVLDQEHHQERDDRGAGVDDELPGVAEAEDRSSDAPRDDRLRPRARRS